MDEEDAAWIASVQGLAYQVTYEKHKIPRMVSGVMYVQTCM